MLVYDASMDQRKVVRFHPSQPTIYKKGQPMKRFIALSLGLALALTLSVGTAQAADKELYVEATHAIDVSNFQLDASEIHLTGVARFGIWKGLGVDSSISHSVKNSSEDILIRVGPRYATKHFEASLTTSFTVGDTGSFGDSALARVRYNF